LEAVSAREWGRRRAAESPAWSEEKWRRVGAILGLELDEPATAVVVRIPDQEAGAGPGAAVAA
jgi:hypothetical protein